MFEGLHGKGRSDPAGAHDHDLGAVVGDPILYVGFELASGNMDRSGDRSLFVTVFDDHSNLGLVRFYAQESSARLKEIFEEIARRAEENPPEGQLSDDFSSSASAALDELF